MDGVGGWADEGVDAGLYSRQLVSDIHQIYKENKTRGLKDILVEAARINKQTGSSTAVLAKIDPANNKMIRTTNLGDSGYIIYRPDPIEIGRFNKIYRSKE